MRILGLDPGIRNTGWVIIGDHTLTGMPRVVASGVIQTAKGRLVDKRADLLRALRSVHVVGVECVAVETAVRWVGLAVAWATCCTLPLLLTGQREMEHVSAREAKFSLGVAPKAGKPAVLRAVEDVLKFKAPTQHEADAAAVAYAAWLRLSGGSPK